MKISMSSITHEISLRDSGNAAVTAAKSGPRRGPYQPPSPESRVRQPDPSRIITITAGDRGARDAAINEAVESMIAQALREKVCGILVTRHSTQKVTVELNSDVPFGETYEFAIDK
ncbi:hypothetical protein [Arthrobacter sp. SDTb3-6]|uniref:hypothetical protein n=1 Tax=Arthrobacter sp. SDTb3-6 TaxID=2713571 RepID=UPI00159E0091|nr:hypothetical protein [Arthrobacter sp. SDTb3-6]NVN00694.1 hypothetical protein [Arthrobacter sp. SDTb3-6]